MPAGVRLERTQLALGERTHGRSQGRQESSQAALWFGLEPTGGRNFPLQQRAAIEAHRAGHRGEAPICPAALLTGFIWNAISLCRPRLAPLFSKVSPQGARHPYPHDWAEPPGSRFPHALAIFLAGEFARGPQTENEFEPSRANSLTNEPARADNAARDRERQCEGQAARWWGRGSEEQGPAGGEARGREARAGGRAGGRVGLESGLQAQRVTPHNLILQCTGFRAICLVFNRILFSSFGEPSYAFWSHMAPARQRNTETAGSRKP
ncbi:uncharacterized protein VTP21DRAFT_4369 [Calcarisporiella thermophila]|uniref:uncharacterized protein n=1 Tax=Calcarisporiella thermophila TaxID=911321 RepID=UPI0037431669